VATPICSGTIGHRSTERGGNFSRLSTVAADPATISGPPRQPDRVLPDPAARLIDLARAQHGLLTPAQARAAGLRRYAVDVALAGGAVERRAGLLRGRDVTPDDLSRVRVQSALLLAGRDAVTAARPPRGCMVSRALQQSPRSPFWCPRTASGTSPRRRRPPQRRGPSGPHCVDGIAVTSPLRTVVDCARRSEHVVAVCLLESAVRLGLVTVDEVRSRLDAFRPRTSGVPAARRALSRIDLRSESPLETVARLRCSASATGTTAAWRSRPTAASHICVKRCSTTTGCGGRLSRRSASSCGGSPIRICGSGRRTS
jgi:hypothetical protein